MPTGGMLRRRCLGAVCRHDGDFDVSIVGRCVFSASIFIDFHSFVPMNTYLVPAQDVC